MKEFAQRRAKLSQKLSETVISEKMLGYLTGNLGQAAREAIEEANSLTIEKVTIYLDRLPRNFDGFRIVHLSDIHHSPFTSLDHIQRAVEVSNSLKPDMFILTGDYVSHETEYIAPMAEAMGALVSEFGTYACLGNHDHWTDAELVTYFLEKEGIKVLNNEGFRFQAKDSSFWLCGVDDFTAGKPNLRAALRGSLKNEMKLLLAHNPKTLNRAARAGIDLMLSGHTHGGQIRLRPTNEGLIMPRNRRISGLHQRKETQVYITRGIGTVVLPVRYQCPPEISLIQLRSNV